MKEKLVSIIVPVYKVEKYLDRCIESIINQTYKNIEIILVDDGSPDNCPRLCDDWAKRDNRIVVLHKENGGVSSARNLGIEKATGEYIQFVDSDDYLDEKYTESMINAFTDDSDLVVAGFKIVDLEGKTTINDFSNCLVTDPLVDAESFMSFYTAGYIDPPVNKLYKKSLIDHRFDTTLPLGEDKLFNLTYISKMKNKIAYAHNTGYNYIFNSSSACHKQRANYASLQMSAVNNIKNFLEKYFGTLPQSFYVVAESLLVTVAVRANKESYVKDCKQMVEEDAFKLCIEHYKPTGFKDKFKHWLISRRHFRLLRFVSRVFLRLR